MHGDVKPSNVLLGLRDGKVVSAKVCDFGMSRIKTSFEQTTTARAVQGTGSYMAPEQLRGKVRVKCNFATDVWATASTIVEAFMGKDLWQVPVERDAADFIRNCLERKVDPPTLADAVSSYSQVFVRLQAAFSVQPKNRPDMKALHKIF